MAQTVVSKLKRRCNYTHLLFDMDLTDHYSFVPVCSVSCHAGSGILFSGSTEPSDGHQGFCSRRHAAVPGIGYGCKSAA
jgi:hypothetical protein